MKGYRLPPRRTGRKQKETWYGSTGMIWSLDGNDLRRLWQEVTPESGLTLRQAMLHYDTENLAELFCDLEAQGYDGEPPMLFGIDGWPTPPESLAEFRINARRLREARDRLEFCLVQKLVTGKLSATGHASSAALDEPAQPIAPDRWRILTADFEKSTASAPGVEISGILIFTARQKREPRPAPRSAAPARVRKWYKRWVQENVVSGMRPKREEELVAAREALGAPVSRDLLRDLRRELAPDEWKQHGRPRRRG